MIDPHAFHSTRLASIQLDDIFRPDNLPDFNTVQEVNSEHPEIDFTQSTALYIGGLVSQVLLFTGALAVIMLILAGANYIFAFGKDERIEKAKRGIFWVLVGLIVILLSYAIVQGVMQVIVQLDQSAG